MSSFHSGINLQSKRGFALNVFLDTVLWQIVVKSSVPFEEHEPSIA